MNDLYLIASGAGLQDGINPCIFMACVVLIAQGRWFNLSPLFINNLRFIFGLVYVMGVLVFDFGPAQSFILQKSFIFSAKSLYLVLGLGAFVLGIIFFNEWFLYRRDRTVQVRTSKEIKFLSMSGMLALLTTVILSVILSASATLWPIDRYIFILGNVALSKGQWDTALPLIVIYAIISLWPFWLVWTFLIIKNLRPSLLRIVSAAVSFTASSCMILIFK